MCVYPLTVPISSLSLSLPPGPWPICLPGLQAWSYRSGPCQPHWDTRMCVEVCMSVCASICYNRGASSDRAPPTPTLWERTCLCVCMRGLFLLHPANEACVRMHLPTDLWSCLRVHMSISIFISSKRAWCHDRHHQHDPFKQTVPPLHSSFSGFWTRWGARVTSDPLPHYDWWDSPALSPLLCTLMGIWHLSDPFIKNTSTMHLSF